MKTRYFSLGSVPDLQFFLSSNTIEIELVTTVVTQTVNTLQLEAGKQKNYAEYKSSLDYFYLPPPLHPLPPPTNQKHFYVRSEAHSIQEISTKAWLVSHVRYFKIEGSIDRKQRGIPKLRDLLRRQRRDSEVTV